MTHPVLLKTLYFSFNLTAIFFRLNHVLNIVLIISELLFASFFRIISQTLYHINKRFILKPVLNLYSIILIMVYIQLCLLNFLV